MNVEQLIEKLQEIDPGATVLLEGAAETCWSLRDVVDDENGSAAFLLVGERVDVKTDDHENDVPIVDDFWAGVRAEKEHQLKRWGTTSDRNKAPSDWFWLAGYLGGKALAAAIKGDREKALHHCISTAAVLANWHDAISSAGRSLKVEHEPSQEAFAENPDPTRPSDLERHLGESAQ